LLTVDDRALSVNEINLLLGGAPIHEAARGPTNLC
jgi:hypothetical protein